MTDRITHSGSQTQRLTPERGRQLELGSDPGQLIDRITKLRMLLPAFAQETAEARREVARLRSQITTLQRRVAELETRSGTTGNLTSR